MRGPATLSDAAFGPATPLDELRAALATLTRIPVGGVRGDVSGAAAFGAVGGLVGVVGSVPLLVLGTTAATTMVAAILAVAVVAAMSGAFHLDGLADTADALVAIGPTAAERARKDPRLGAGGAVALVSIVILDVACLEPLLRTAGPIGAAALLVVAAAGSRAFAVGVASLARGRAVGEGMGARFAASVTTLAAVVAGGSAAVLGLLATPIVGPIAVAALLVGWAVAGGLVALVIRARHQLDGDGLGAAVELSFSAILVAGVVIAAVT